MTTDNQPMSFPPVYPKVSYGRKIFLMGLQCCLLMFGVLAVWLMSYSRERTTMEVTESITSGWGTRADIQGPVVVEHLGSERCIRSIAFDCDVEVRTKSLHRSIYEVEVFDAQVEMSGSFCRSELANLGDSVVFELKVDVGRFDRIGKLVVDGKEIQWSVGVHGLFAKVDVANVPDMPSNVNFSTSFEVRGSGTIDVRPLSKQASVVIHGEASNPSFYGNRYAKDRSVQGRLFSARWESDGSGSCGTHFLVGVNHYLKVSRSLKYSFIIILLTFISVLFVELLWKQPIPLLNYFLVGAALIVFYSLLLSFTELVAFGYAYLIASVMTVLLITGYMWKMLDSRKLGLFIGAVLSAMYGCCYVMLCASTYALLLGSLLLFIALAAMMYGSLKIKY